MALDGRGVSLIRIRSLALLPIIAEEMASAHDNFISEGTIWVWQCVEFCYVVASLKIVVALNFENPTERWGRQEQEYHSIWPATPNVPTSLFNIWRQTDSVGVNRLAEGFRNSLRYSLRGLTTRGLATNHTVPADVKPGLMSSNGNSLETFNLAARSSFGSHRIGCWVGPCQLNFVLSPTCLLCSLIPSPPFCLFST